MTHKGHRRTARRLQDVGRELDACTAAFDLTDFEQLERFDDLAAPRRSTIYS